MDSCKIYQQQTCERFLLLEFTFCKLIVSDQH